MTAAQRVSIVLVEADGKESSFVPDLERWVIAVRRKGERVYRQVGGSRTEIAADERKAS